MSIQSLGGPQLRQARMIIAELLAQGLRQFFICPGNQSSPLAAALCEFEAQGAHLNYHFDERAAAFMALGYARASGRAAAVVCTSGSALANLYPAVLEADAADIPLLLLTADRPEELQEVSANQSFRQTNFFSSQLRWSFECAAAQAEMSGQHIAAVQGAAAYAAARCQQYPAGPVHLNLRFRKPFFDAVQTPSPRVRAPHFAVNQTLIAESEIRRIATRISRAKRGIISVGALSPQADRQAIEQLAEKLQWPLYASVLSGLRRRGFGGLCASHWYLSDAEIRSELAPDFVLHLGAEPPKPGNAVVRYLEQGSIERLRVCESSRRIDPLHNTTTHVQVEPSWFARALTEHLRPTPSALREAFEEHESSARALLAQQATLSELTAVQRLFTHLTAEQQLLLANSLPIRLAEFAAYDGAPEIISNRGLSGIDGTLATACGACEANKKPTVVLSGDLAFLYDATSLVYAKRRALPLLIVVLNNDGGGIFSLTERLPYQSAIAERYQALMQTPHGLELRGFADWLEIPYVRPETLEEFEAACDRALHEGNVQIIEVVTNAEETARQLKSLEAACSSRGSA